MSIEFKWLGHCVKQIDVTNIGKQHSLIDAINNTDLEDEIDNLIDIEI